MLKADSVTTGHLFDWKVYVSSFTPDSIEDARLFKQEFIELVKSAGYELRNWSTNKLQLLNGWMA